MLGKIESKRRKGVTEDETVGWHHQLVSLSKLQEIVRAREAWSAAVHGVTKSRTQINDWKTPPTVLYPQEISFRFNYTK